LRQGDRVYLILFIASLIAVSALFIWFQFLSHVNGEAIVGDIINEATKLSRRGKYHDTLIDAEILGVDLGKTEWPLHVQNFVELPFFLILISPFIYVGASLAKEVLKGCRDLREKIPYVIVMLGAVTTLPLFIMKIDYGRWMLAIFAYYLIMLIVLVALDDEIVIRALEIKAKWLRENKTWGFMLIIYAIVFLPLWDVRICQLLKSS
jgi:hypothetical protein